MIEEPTPPPPPTMDGKPASFSAVVTASLLTCLLAGGGIIAVHESLKSQTAELQYEVSDTLEKLTRRVSALENQTRELAARPVADNAPVEELRSGVAEARSTLTALSERVAEMEKKPVSALPVDAPTMQTQPVSALKSSFLSGAPYQAELAQWVKEHPKSSSSTQTLEANAANGMPTEAALKKELRELLAKQSAPTKEFDDKTLAGRLNTHLSNFISIKKKNTAAPELAALETKLETASLPELEAEIRSLQTALRAPFEHWLQSVATRAKALNELAQLGAL